ncbi:hypothetical protein BDR07DRAFT_1374475 [Suillus spraguei]|nr:hypothetical protein BDR07DRAFT_1374475 [Suillus spraguei]
MQRMFFGFLKSCDHGFGSDFQILTPLDMEPSPDVYRDSSASQSRSGMGHDPSEHQNSRKEDNTNQQKLDFKGKADFYEDDFSVWLWGEQHRGRELYDGKEDVTGIQKGVAITNLASQCCRQIFRSCMNGEKKIGNLAHLDP